MVWPSPQLSEYLDNKERCKHIKNESKIVFLDGSFLIRGWAKQASSTESQNLA